VSSIPPNNGHTSFRPVYFSTVKVERETTSVDLSLLPLLNPGPLNNGVALSWIEDAFEKVQLDHREGWTGRDMHPKQNLVPRNSS